jgi:hypothetical protein
VGKGKQTKNPPLKSVKDGAPANPVSQYYLDLVQLYYLSVNYLYKKQELGHPPALCLACGELHNENGARLVLPSEKPDPFPDIPFNETPLGKLMKD